MIKTCGNCKHAEFKKKSNGAINPKQPGRCRIALELLEEIKVRAGELPYGVLLGINPFGGTVWADYQAETCKKWEAK